MEFFGEWLECGRQQKDTLGLERAANAKDGSRELFFQKRARFLFGEVWVERTFEDVREHQAQFLEFGKDGFAGLPFCGEWDGLEDCGGFTFEGRVWRVEKVVALGGSDAGEEKGLDVDGAEAGGPGESFEAARHVGGVDELATTVAGEERSGHKSRVEEEGRGGKWGEVGKQVIGMSVVGGWRKNPKSPQTKPTCRAHGSG